MGKNYSLLKVLLVLFVQNFGIWVVIVWWKKRFQFMIWTTNNVIKKLAASYVMMLQNGCYPTSIAKLHLKIEVGVTPTAQLLLDM